VTKSHNSIKLKTGTSIGKIGAAISSITIIHFGMIKHHLSSITTFLWMAWQKASTI